MKKIAKTAFNGNEKIYSVTFPESVEEIEANALIGCDKLSYINFYGDKITIGDNLAALTNEKLEIVTIRTNYNTDAFSYAKENCYAYEIIDEKTAFTIVDGVLTKYSGAGERIVIPDTVKSISEQAIREASDAKYIYIPASVETITEQGIFYNMSMTEYDVDENSPYFCAVDGVLFTKDMKTLVLYPTDKAETSYTVPDGVETIGHSAFRANKHLESVILPSSVKNIDFFAFCDARELSSINLPEGLTTIGHYALADCDKLLSVTIPDSVTVIWFSAFDYRADNFKIIGRTGSAAEDYAKEYSIAFESNGQTAISPFVIVDGVLTEYNGNAATVVIPDAVTTLARCIFYNNNFTKTIHIPASVETIETDGTTGCTSLCEFDVDENNPNFCDVDGVLFTKDMKTLICYPSQKEGASYIVPNGVETIASGAFMDAANIEKVTLPDSLKSIKDSSFRYYRKLKEINIPYGVREIMYCAFAQDSLLESLTIPETVGTYGEDVFSYDDYENETTYSCYDGFTNSRTEAYAKENNMPFESTGIASEFIVVDGVLICYNGKGGDVIIPDSVTEIYQELFYENNEITSVTIPSSVKTIGDYAFYDCKNIKTLTLNEGLETIGDSAFDLCAAIESVNIKSLTLNEGLETIGVCAFDSCADIESINIPKSVKTIGNDAFCDSNKSNKAAVKGMQTEIGEHAFGYTYDSDTEEYGKADGFTLCGLAGSKAEAYAKANEIAFVVTDFDPPVTSSTPESSSKTVTTPISTTEKVPESVKETDETPAKEVKTIDVKNLSTDKAVESIAEAAKEAKAVKVEIDEKTLTDAATLISAIEGKDVDLTLDCGEYSWTINGSSVSGDLQDIDLHVSFGTENIAEEKVSEKLVQLGVEPSETIQLSLAYSGEFGFDGTLNYPVDKSLAGQKVVVYYFNEESGEFEVSAISEVDENGNIAILFMHASEYLMVLSDEFPEEILLGETVTTVPEDEETAEPQTLDTTKPVPEEDGTDEFDTLDTTEPVPEAQHEEPTEQASANESDKSANPPTGISSGVFVAIIICSGTGIVLTASDASRKKSKRSDK